MSLCHGYNLKLKWSTLSVMMWFQNRLLLLSHVLTLLSYTKAPMPAVNHTLGSYNGHVTGDKYALSIFQVWHGWGTIRHTIVENVESQRTWCRKKYKTKPCNPPGFPRNQLRNAGFYANTRSLASVVEVNMTVSLQSELLWNSVFFGMNTSTKPWNCLNLPPAWKNKNRNKGF